MQNKKNRKRGQATFSDKKWGHKKWGQAPFFQKVKARKKWEQFLLFHRDCLLFPLSSRKSSLSPLLRKRVHKYERF
jgi:hypothetical protein